jgi:L-cystine uptake protein TcyP (sodium:dicarboxylate symporter family)
LAADVFGFSPAVGDFCVMQTESRKLRWYAPIWKEPLRWARWVGNSRVNLVCAVVVQLAFCGMWIGSLFSFATVRSIDELGWLSHVPLVFLVAVAFLASVFIPAAYIYALYRLIGIIDEMSKWA